MPRRVLATDVPPQAWRNGGGRTRELLCWPDQVGWTLRISLADIDADGPFSAFPGVTRWFSVIEGAGVRLAFAQGERAVRLGDAPLRFDGAAAPGCTLVDGPTRDLNLMSRAGTSTMSPVTTGHAWSDRCAVRALFTATAGRWTDGRQTLDLPPHALLWQPALDDTPWRLTPDGSPAVAGWWLGHTPHEGSP